MNTAMNIAEPSGYMRTTAITIDPETMGGTPVFTGTRVPIQHLFDYLQSGESLEEFLENFPSVSREQSLEVIKLAGRFFTAERLLHEDTVG